MALTPSHPFPLGKVAPGFTLPDTTSGKDIALGELKGVKGTVIMFICNHCPYVLHVNKELVRLANDYSDKGISFAAISSNDVEKYPQDGPAMMRLHAMEHDYPFPYLYDASQMIAKNYNAACTPEFYVFDGQLECVYHGQLDASRPGTGLPVTGEDVRQALDHLLAGEQPLVNQRPSIGCGIKWK